jgi:hypothetical protein
MNVHELTMDESPKTADLAGTIVESARQRTSIESRGLDSSEQLRSKRPIESSMIKPSLERREDTAPGTSAVGRNADIFRRTSVPEDEFDKTKMAAELSLIKSSLKTSHTPALMNQHVLPADISPQTSDSDDEFDDNCDSMRDLFKKSYEYIRPGPLFRFAVNFYAERKLFVFFWIHFVATMIIWGKSSEDVFEPMRDGCKRSF